MMWLDSDPAQKNTLEITLSYPTFMTPLFVVVISAVFSLQFLHYLFKFFKIYSWRYTSYKTFYDEEVRVKRDINPCSEAREKVNKDDRKRCVLNNPSVSLFLFID